MPADDDRLTVALAELTKQLAELRKFASAPIGAGEFSRPEPEPEPEDKEE